MENFNVLDWLKRINEDFVNWKLVYSHVDGDQKSYGSAYLELSIDNYSVTISISKSNDIHKMCFTFESTTMYDITEIEYYEYLHLFRKYGERGDEYRIKILNNYVV